MEPSFFPLHDEAPSSFAALLFPSHYELAANKASILPVDHNYIIFRERLVAH